jgi:hypothetical protein
MDICQRFQKPFDPLIKGATQSIERGNVVTETIDSISDVLKRDSSHARQNYYSFPMDVTTDVTNIGYINRWEPFHYFSSMFLFWRGGRKLGVLYESNGWRPSHYPETFSTLGDSRSSWPATATAPYIQPSLIIPWYSTMPYFPVNNSNGPPTYPISEIPVDVDTVGTPANPNIISGADDFVLLFPHPYWVPEYVAPSSKALPRPQSRVAAPNYTSDNMIPNFAPKRI